MKKALITMVVMFVLIIWPFGASGSSYPAFSAAAFRSLFSTRSMAESFCFQGLLLSVSDFFKLAI